MAVIKRPPLIVPPDYNLRPPRSGSEDDGSNAASDAARKTLIGPSSSIDAAPSEARAILTGTNSENDVSDAASEGQNLLVSRSQRAERDLDKVVETRAENRVDRALLRRLLAWTPDSRTDASDDAESEDAVVVQLVSRSQTVIDAIPDQTSTE